MRLPVGKRKDPGPSKTKKCPVCETENALNSQFCSECLFEFATSEAGTFESCTSCGGLNPKGFINCQHCGHKNSPSYEITLKDALREGAIVRGIELTEDEVLGGEALAKTMRQKTVKKRRR